ncbi:hypothetical protein BD779DRAFT_319092 [Infundibulicybe gibba]|nr:hypothetical protein BD779DRAFT_319092 [Infundibulicybe gibba]
MKPHILAPLFLAGVSQVLATPTNTTLLSRYGKYYDIPRCGVAGNAVASECDTLLSSNFTLNFKRTCASWGPVVEGTTAFNPVCSPGGGCCIYTTDDTLTVDKVRKYGWKALMRCRSDEKDKINGRVLASRGHLCISDGKGCNDCFVG